MTTAVLKFGGEVIADAPALSAVLADVARLTAVGWQVAICHGGGPQANALQERLGLVPRKVGGSRVTDEATLQVIRGRVRLVAGDDSWDGVAGDHVTIPPARHALQALDDSAVLLTVSVGR